MTPSLFVFREMKWVYNEEITKGYLKTKRRNYYEKGIHIESYKISRE